MGCKGVRGLFLIYQVDHTCKMLVHPVFELMLCIPNIHHPALVAPGLVDYDASPTFSIVDALSLDLGVSVTLTGSFNKAQ